MNERLIQPKLKRRKLKIEGDPSRVITRLHLPSEERALKIIQRVSNIEESEAEALLEQVFYDFSERHKHFQRILERNFDQVSERLRISESLSETKRLLLGAYFTMEYAIESAALFNPSIVPHPDQSNLKEGSLRFIMSLRATGEGHISSIVFRSGEVDAEQRVLVHPPAEHVYTPDICLSPLYDRHLFQLKLFEMHAANATTDLVLADLPDQFSYHDFQTKLDRLSSDPYISLDQRGIEIMYWLINSNYTIAFSDEHPLSERVIFPISENEISGIEDARFVQFFDENGEATYYATYTAYNGFEILPQMLETKDFLTFNIMTLNGRAAQNKGMALFPRKVNGMYAMLSRQDGENNYIMFSDHIRFWNEAKLIQEPKEPWEFIQIGNCGSPIELDEGWLVLTHGVGPMRRYCIGAMLLDLKDPSRVIARMEDPLLVPRFGEREGYVPNVVYSCGALLHNDELILPYAMSDTATGVASISVSDLLDCLTDV